jgi:cadmium resistance protein CadD (predicted permease)
VIELVSLIGLSAVVFVATNIDDLLLLVGFFADSRIRNDRVVIGQFVGMAVLVAASVFASLISLVIPAAYVGLLGLLPIAIGTKALFDDDFEPSTRETRGDAPGQIASVAAITIANGGDNLGVYVPWFATQTAEQIAIAVLVFIHLTALWLAFAHWLVHHRTIGSPIRRYGRVAMPFVLIALGIAILYEARSFALLDQAMHARGR